MKIFEFTLKAAIRKNLLNLWKDKLENLQIILKKARKL
jgi:hypothetical protein